jgi:hypothetical protein
MSVRRRIDALESALDRLQQRRIRRLYAEAAAEYGLDPDELQADCERFLSQPLADQLAEVDRLTAELGSDGVDVEQIKATLTEHYRP